MTSLVISVSMHGLDSARTHSQTTHIAPWTQTTLWHARRYRQPGLAYKESSCADDDIVVLVERLQAHVLCAIPLLGRRGVALLDDAQRGEEVAMRPAPPGSHAGGGRCRAAAARARAGRARLQAGLRGRLAGREARVAHGGEARAGAQVRPHQRLQQRQAGPRLPPRLQDLLRSAPALLSLAPAPAESCTAVRRSAGMAQGRGGRAP